MAQFGQSARLGAVRSQVRILLSRFFVGNKPFLGVGRKNLCMLSLLDIYIMIYLSERGKINGGKTGYDTGRTKASSN